MFHKYEQMSFIELKFFLNAILQNLFLDSATKMFKQDKNT